MVWDKKLWIRLKSASHVRFTGHNLTFHIVYIICRPADAEDRGQCGVHGAGPEVLPRVSRVGRAPGRRDLDPAKQTRARVQADATCRAGQEGRHVVPVPE